MSKDLTKIQNKVLYIIKMWPESANDDAALLSNYWNFWDGWQEDKSLHWNLSRVTRPETLSRRRRELYNLGLIEYSTNSLNRRTEAYKNETEGHSQLPTKLVPQIITNADGEQVVVFNEGEK